MPSKEEEKGVSARVLRGGAKPIEKVAEKVEILTGWAPLSLQKWLVNTLQQIFAFDTFFPCCW